MEPEYNPTLFWNERFAVYGHTGSGDQLLYEYDQPQRLRALQRALRRAGITVSSTMNILDVGCGTGDFIAMLADWAHPRITGIDVSTPTVRSAQSRFAGRKDVTLINTAIEHADFVPETFDLVVGINVLQHIVDERMFAGAVANIVRFLKTGGHVAVMDFSPIQSKPTSASFLKFRTRAEYINIFERTGCRFISEFGLPRLGVRLYRNPMLEMLTREPDSASKNLAGVLRFCLRRTLLRAAAPFDLLLAPFPSRWTDMRILIFRK